MRPHLRVARMHVVRASSCAEQSNARSTPAPPVSAADVVHVRASRRQDLLEEPQRLRQLQPFRQDVDPDHVTRPERPADHRGREADRPETRDQHRVVAADADALDALVHGPEPARHLRAVRVGQRLGQQDEVLLLGQHVVGHASVALPPVRAPVVARARDHVAAPAVVAHATTGDVVDDDAVTRLEAAAAGAGVHDLAARLVPGDHARLVALGPLAEMLVVDATDVRPADGRALRADQDLAVPGSGDGELPQLGSAVARKDETTHRLVHGSPLRCVTSRWRP